MPDLRVRGLPRRQRRLMPAVACTVLDKIGWGDLAAMAVALVILYGLWLLVGWLMGWV